MLVVVFHYTGKKKTGFAYVWVVVKVFVVIICDLVMGIWRFFMKNQFFLYVNLNIGDNEKPNTSFKESSNAQGIIDTQDSCYNFLK